MIRTVFSAAVFAALGFLGLTSAAFAQDVTLTSRDGGISLNGTLLSFDGEFYRVETVYGVLILDGQGVRCTGTGCPDLADYVAEFSFSGAPALGEVLLPALVEAYADRRGLGLRRVVKDDRNFRMDLLDEASGQPLARIGFRINSTAEGFADLLSDEASLVMAIREVTESEAAMIAEAGLGDLTDPARAQVVALDALLPVVARGNPVTALSVSQLQGYLSGAVTTWQDQQAPVAVHLPAADNGLAAAIDDSLMRTVQGGQVPLAGRHQREADLVDAVAADPLALGVTRLSEIGNAVPVALSGDCGLALPVDRRSLKTEDYPFTAPLLLYSPKQRLPLFAREFLDFLTTPAAQIVIRKAGFIDQGREEIPLNDQGLRLANALRVAGNETPLSEVQDMLQRLQDAVRLTQTFRFKDGGTALDIQSNGNVGDLARALESGVFDGRELIFVGFYDGTGPWEQSKAQAQAQATAVRDEVKTRAFAANQAQLRLRVASFGEAMPVACDDTPWGARANRRVEVWLR